MSERSPIDITAELCDEAAVLAGDGPAADAIAGVRARLFGPLRVAIAGRVNAGKSTLLNALVGERLAPTDAGECTRLVTWYQEGIGYAVTATLADGSTQPVPFTREDGALDLDIGGIGEIDHLVVSWPSRRLQTMTLIDTPGIEGRDAARDARARDFLGGGDGGSGEADAVIYLMRHLHQRDADFLETFTDRSLPHPSPSSAIAVLSRADEIGAGRLDSLASAARIAARYASDARVRTLSAAVLPVAGLIAETAVTLQEQEVAALRSLATGAAEDREALLLSVDRFCAPGAADVPAAVRRSLLARLGLFGVRYCIAQLADGRASSAADLSALLTAASGIDELIATLDELFAGRAAVLKARTALSALAAIVGQLADGGVAGADAVAGAIERVQMGTAEFVALRLTHLAMDPDVGLSDDELREIERLTSPGGPAERLGLGPDAGRDEVRAAALRGVATWRARAEHPLTAGSLAEACDLIVRSYEALYAAS